MISLDQAGLLAIDVGNSQVKFGWYPPEAACTRKPQQSDLPVAAPRLVQPEETLACAHFDVPCEEFMSRVGDWLDQLPTEGLRCCLASVHAEAQQWVLDLLDRYAAGSLHVLSVADLPIEVRVDEPEKVGIDRLLSAMAANRLRKGGRSAVVVSLGTACTVNLISGDGAFEGGAILPGITMSAAALYSGTSALPLLSSPGNEVPDDGVGKSTQAAIAAGLFWGLVGAVRELSSRMTRSCQESPQLFLTGGDAPRLAEKMASADIPVQYVPNMVLAGIHLAAKEMG